MMLRAVLMRVASWIMGGPRSAEKNMALLSAAATQAYLKLHPAWAPKVDDIARRLRNEVQERDRVEKQSIGTTLGALGKRAKMNRAEVFFLRDLGRMISEAFACGYFSGPATIPIIPIVDGIRGWKSLPIK